MIYNKKFSLKLAFNKGKGEKVATNVSKFEQGHNESVVVKKRNHVLPASSKLARRVVIEVNRREKTRVLERFCKM